MTASPQSPPPPLRHDGSNDDQHVRTSPRDARPSDDSDGDDRASEEGTDRVPRPRQGGTTRRSQTVTNHVPATLAAGPDGALWIMVDGADVQEVAAKVNAVCALLTAVQPPRSDR